MKILFVSQYFFPERVDFSDVCREFVKNGDEVTVLTGLPNYHLKENKVPKNYKYGKNRKEVIDGIKVIRCTEFGRRNNVFNLFLNYVSFYFSSLRKVKALDKDFDRVICYQYSPITMAAAAAKYARKNKCPFILYCFDVWPESLKVYGIGEKNPIFKIVYRISRKIYDSCDKILITSKPFAKYFETVHKVPKKKIFYLPQFTRDYGKDLKKVKSDGKVHLLFAGNVGKAQNVDCIIEAVEKIKTDEDFVVDIVGNGSERQRLAGLVKQKKLGDKIIFHGEKGEKDMIDFYSRADALLLTMKDNGTYVSKTMPLKTQSYMSTGKPILTSINGAAKETIEEYKCGYCAPANDVDAFAKIIKMFIEERPKVSYKMDERFLLEGNVKELIELVKGDV